MRVRDAPPSQEPQSPVFKLSPQRMELNPRESINIELEACVDNPQIIQKRLLCHNIIGRTGGNELIMKVQVNCECITPLLEVSTDHIQFRTDKGPAEELQSQSKPIALTNISSLPLTANLKLEYPFQMIGNAEERQTEMDLFLGIGEEKVVMIEFDPAYKEDHHTRVIEETLTISYKEHPHVDTVSLQGEVYLPHQLFERDTVDFGCILNDTEVTCYINITNNSSMDVQYRCVFPPFLNGATTRLNYNG